MSIEDKANRRGKRALQGLLGLFMRDANGATAIEFTMLAIPFFLLTFAIIETCVSFTAQQIVSNSADEIAREFRTGQLRPNPTNQAELAQKVRDSICGNMELMVAKGCPELAIDLRQFTSFAEAAAIRTKFTASGDLDTSDFDINPGTATSRNILRVYYKWPVITDLLRASMSTLPGNKMLLSATAIWQNEPFPE